MSRDWLLYLDDMIASAEKIGRLIHGHTREQFVADEAAFDAVLFHLLVLGEGIKSLPDGVRASLPDAQRSAPARLRDLIAHRYFALDPDIIREVASKHVPPLLEQALTLRDRADRAEDPGESE